MQLCAAFKQAEMEIIERTLRVESCWIRTEAQLVLLQNLADVLDPDHQSNQHQTLEVLLSKLKIVISRFDSVLSKSEQSNTSLSVAAPEPRSVNRWKYALQKESLDKAIEDIETWQRIFDPSWFLIIKAATPQIDEELSRYVKAPATSPLSSALSLRNALRDSPQSTPPIFLPETGLQSAVVSDIPFSSAKTGYRADKGLIVETITCPPQINTSALTRNIRNLARKLSYAEPAAFGLLNCKGVVKLVDNSTRKPTSFTFVFRMPDDLSEPRSLRGCLISGDSNHSLSDRFKLANQLAKSVFHIHTFGFVHKNIRPETILILKSADSWVGSAFLAGFQHVRTAEEGTLRYGDSLWERNLYRHPSRQGQNPKEDYCMQHDIYSLGVCLLELGLWQSFVGYHEDGKTTFPLSALELSPGSPELQVPPLLKDSLVCLARTTLPYRMGTRYAEIVETCLTCLDDNNTDFGDEEEFHDEDGILVGVRYIEKVSSPSAFSRDEGANYPRFSRSLVTYTPR